MHEVTKTFKMDEQRSPVGMMNVNHFSSYSSFAAYGEPCNSILCCLRIQKLLEKKKLFSFFFHLVIL